MLAITRVIYCDFRQIILSPSFTFDSNVELPTLFSGLLSLRQPGLV